MTARHFKLQLANELLDNSESHEGSEGVEEEEEEAALFKKRIQHPEAASRRSGARHMPVMVDCHHAERCRNQGCKSKTYMRCISCKMFLCITKK